MRHCCNNDQTIFKSFTSHVLLSNTMTCLLVACLSVSIVADDAKQAAPQPAKSVTEKELATLLHPSFHAQAAKYEFYLDKEHTQSLKLVDQPLMSWTGEGSWYGDVFIWTHENRPQMIGCVGSWPIGKETRGMFHEFHVLAVKPIQGVRLSPIYTWKHSEPGITFENCEGPAWSKSASRRLFQMRQIARSFTGHMKDNDGDPTVLRMLPQPIYRYAIDAESTSDGAIFAYVWDVGTDPELILIVETEQHEKTTTWRFAAARFTWRELSLKRKDKIVWQVPEHQEQHQTRTLRKSYVTVEVGGKTMEQLRSDYAEVQATKKKQP